MRLFSVFIFFCNHDDEEIQIKALYGLGEEEREREREGGSEGERGGGDRDRDIEREREGGREIVHTVVLFQVFFV